MYCAYCAMPMLGPNLGDPNELQRV